MRKIITVNYLRKIKACHEAIQAFEAQTEKDTIKVLLKCLDVGHFDWASWLITKLLTRKQRLEYVIYCAKLILPFWEQKYPTDKRPRRAINAAKTALAIDNTKNRHAANNAADAAYAAAYAAAAAHATDATNAAWVAACVAAYAAHAAHATDVADAVDAAVYAEPKTIKTKIIKYGIKLLKGRR